MHSLLLRMLPPLQAEVSAVNSERERLRDSANAAGERIAALESELETAKQVSTLHARH